MAGQETKRPLGVSLGSDLNGTLTIYSVVPLEEFQATKEGIFSFVLYYHKKNEEFKYSLYYKGIYSYLECIKRGGRFSNWSVIIYTDSASIELLQTAFPFEDFPMLLLCVVDWPPFTDSRGLPSPEMLRTLRFQCAELFPSQICCIRDADTLFQGVLSHCPALDQELVEFIVALEAWEREFIDVWLEGKLIPNPIVIGSDLTYAKPWHSNFPAPVPWRVDVYQNNEPKKNIIDSPLGMFAGFVNFAADKSAFPELWTYCVRYLGERYMMVRGGFENQYSRIISNKHSQSITGGIVGKDEKILIFVVAKLFFANCFIFPIQYIQDLSRDSYTNIPGGFVNNTFPKIKNCKPYPKRSVVISDSEENSNNETSSAITNNEESPGVCNSNQIYRYTIPRIIICGYSSHMLNPEYILFMLKDARVFSKGNSPNTITSSTVPVAIKNKFSNFYIKYDRWKTTLNIPTFLDKVKRIEKKHFIALKKPPSMMGWMGVGNNYNILMYNKRLNSPLRLEKLFDKMPDANLNRLVVSEDLDDMFLQQVGPYNPEEEESYRVKLKAERNLITNIQREKERVRVAEMGTAPRRFGGVRCKTRKHHRFTKKKRVTKRHRS